MEALAKLASVLGLSLTSGVNLYATVAIVGLVTKFELIQGLPQEFQTFSNDIIIVLAIVLYICEFAADKVPWFDSFWDSFHTFIRPFGGAWVALTVVGDADPTVKVVTALLAASLSLTTHATKAGVRLVVNTSPEPFSNMIVSVAEDVGVLGLVLLAMSHPLASLILSLVLLGLLVAFGPGLWRGALVFLRSVLHRISGVFSPQSEALPKEHMPNPIELKVDATLGQGETAQACLNCFARKIKGAGRNRAGSLVLTDRRLLFAYRRFFATRVQEWALDEIEDVRFMERFFVNVLEIKKREDKQGGRFCQLIFLKRQSLKVRSLMDLLPASSSSSGRMPVASPQMPNPREA